ncbi:hypothetical protein ROZALSC1DRAFT_28420 [Rozella allomycis CSF55]|uniref:60S acidic ribosomal protein P0 n=1 Tax=Rozella allomycis (strain CSF55) TaxID=988480 RepID=A0A075ASU5_ROZAC|nr:Ribosomal protein L10/acidic P0 domain-containing protein [Rozella allomycis CSF55]RKP20044.1 hypothetical protein ROZALSC1DRAFT_28420 [Rozella allomycis CSF55]|eukprot:EPZ33240.1 Ribosomal protein L10/acidic P0 domain-containing protein [Rozella allomycis CSF55]
MSKGDSHSRKAEYFLKLNNLFQDYSRVLVVSVDNVGSNQMHLIRKSVRGEAIVLMGKNTMVRKAIRGLMVENPALEKLLPFIKGNVGFVFTNGDLKEVRDKVISYRIKAPAKAGAVAPCNVKIPAGNTGMEPGKTSFFQALGIPTKITKGLIEIISEVNLIQAGTKVGASEATLLNMMNVSPFTYGLEVVQVYDHGAVFGADILDITDETLLEYLTSAIRNIAALSMQLKVPSVASVPHHIINAYKNILAIAAVTDYSFPLAEKMKEYLADPSKFAVAAAPVAAAETKVEEKVEEKEESDEDMGFGLFD